MGIIVALYIPLVTKAIANLHHPGQRWIEGTAPRSVDTHTTHTYGGTSMANEHNRILNLMLANVCAVFILKQCLSTHKLKELANTKVTKNT